MDVEILSPGVIHFKAKTQYEVSAAFMRMQEFYESPYGVRGKFFTLESYMDTYAEKNDNKFTYLTDWAGFNVPGNIVDKFFKMFEDDLLDKEVDLWNQIVEETEKEGGTHNGKYYIIGTYSADSIDHEHCHALWYLYPAFRRASTKLVRSLPKAMRTACNNYLIETGYHKSVLVDETNAYLSTSPMTDIRDDLFENFKPKTFPWDKVYDFQRHFAEFRDEVKAE
jgi:hypothetical protein